MRNRAAPALVRTPPEDALLADLFWEAWHCHEKGPFPRAWDLFDAAATRRMN
ncbi:hypothetical protein AB0D57_26740 [Streptomyces sp. NPDC048275]|uniref:hypothetical protein n=1 Tax=Streptomyces sp. NPDC048275 TaxID=3155629 RepID=UPI0033DFF4F7